MARETIEQILSQVGPDKRWKTVDDLIVHCESVCQRLGPICHFAGGAFGWKFIELIPMLQNERETAV